MKRWLWRLTKWALIGLLLLIVALVAPIAYVETACTRAADRESYKPIITDAEFRREKANSYLTYPEWHIVYAYEGLAEVLKEGDEYRFDYVSSVLGFWSSYCALNEIAQERGGGDLGTRQTIYVIGASFTLEMALKALYEETVGRLFAWLRGPVKTPQDGIAAQIAAEYAAFLQQVPWYKYPFNEAVDRLWNAPAGTSLRGWERRIGLGGEWKTKAAYARVIDQAVAATGLAILEIRSVIAGMSPARLSAIPGVQVIEVAEGHVIINTPRYRAFTKILREIAAQGGTVLEIAGNDEVLVTAIAPLADTAGPPKGATIIARVNRDGFGDRRLLLNAKVRELSGILVALSTGDRRVEHVYDY